MPIDEITSNNPILASVLLNRDRTPAWQASTSLVDVLNPSPAGTAGLDFTPVQQAALLVNDTLQGLNYVPSSPSNALLVNETNPTLTAFVENQTLSTEQQTALAFNDTLQDITTPAVSGENRVATVERRSTPQERRGASQNMPPSPQQTPSNAVATAIVAPAAETPGVNAATPVTTPTSITSPATAATVAREELNPARPVTAQAILDRNPIAVSVYEIRDPNPLPADPKPKKKEIRPPMPISRLRPVDRLALKQEWEKRKESGRHQELASSQPLQERSIRDMISRTNDNLVASGVPLHLVLAKNSEGFCLNIYDCSDDTLCRLSQEIPLDLNELLTILDNLQHETGIIINTNT